MSDQFLGEIRMVGFNFAPSGWAQCNGQLMALAQNTALFSLLGVSYGGDGRTNFGLPNFQAAAPMGSGNGAGLTPRTWGETGGEYTVTLLQNQLAAHNHGVACISGAGSSNTVANNVWASDGGRGAPPVYATGAPTGAMNPADVQLTGGISGSTQPHNNLQPFLTVTFVIALQGIYPQRG
ncbi:MAG TPA: tail fiber protein [Candidatus Sulfotelmatobacter sp.]